MSQVSYAENACRKLFVSSTILDETVHLINKISSTQLHELHKVIIPEAPLSGKAHSYAIEILKVRDLFNVYKQDLEIRTNHKQNLLLGDTLIEMAQKFSREAKLRYRSRDAIINGVVKKEIVILTEGDHPLNKEAKFFAEKHGVKVIYNPYELLNASSDAIYSEKRIFISESMLVNGSIKKDATGIHELAHLLIHQLYLANKYHPFHGEMTSEKGVLPFHESKFSYSKYQSFEEVEAMWSGSRAALREFIRLQERIKGLSDLDARTYKSMVIEKLYAQMLNGYVVSKRTHAISKHNLETLDKLIEVATIEKKDDGHHSIRWTMNGDKNTSYVVEIPIYTTIENPTRDQLKKLLKRDLENKIQIAGYRMKVFELGMNRVPKYKNITHKEALPELISLEKQLSSDRK